MEHANYAAGPTYPGIAAGHQQQINTPTPIYASGPAINAIEQRWMTLRGNYGVLDPALIDFLERDVARLLSIAKAAAALEQAKNAEQYRQATQQVLSAVRTS